MRYTNYTNLMPLGDCRRSGFTDSSDPVLVGGRASGRLGFRQVRLGFLGFRITDSADPSMAVDGNTHLVGLRV